MIKMVCIACPLGCKLEAVAKDNRNYMVTGNKCPRGEKYAINEMTCPTRMVTSTVVFIKGHLKRLPVRTSRAIPKDKIFDCMKLLEELRVEGPIKAGDVIVQNLFGLGIDILASRSM